MKDVGASEPEISQFQDNGWPDQSQTSDSHNILVSETANDDESSDARFSRENATENGVVYPIDGESPHSHNPAPERQKVLLLTPFLEYISCLVYLSAFGILGVLTRYLLKKLFGPGVGSITSDHSLLYLDLPSNMVGSFLMGWWGIVFKSEIATISTHLSVGLTTGFLGSLTTFSGWNQKMVELSVDGLWAKALIGYILGLFLAAYSIQFGVGTAQLARKFSSSHRRNSPTFAWKVDTLKRHFAATALVVTSLFALLAISGRNVGQNAGELWIACLVAPSGVWIRWLLSKFNGRGIGKNGALRWMPLGTLTANVAASCIMAALSTWKKAVTFHHLRRNLDALYAEHALQARAERLHAVINGVQLGFLGCLSTVSTFMAEYYALEHGENNWTAYAYSVVTILLSFGFGMLIFDIPVWVRDYS